MSPLRRYFPKLAFVTTMVLIVVACAVAPQASPPPEQAPGAPAAEPTEVGVFMPTPTAAALFTQAAIAPDFVDTQTPVGPQPAIPESRRLTLEFPPLMKTGDAARIRLQLEVDDLGNLTPTANVEGNVVVGETVQIPNLYETHHVVVEARLDLAGMEVRPPGAINEPLLPGQSVTFYWSVRPESAGDYQGVIMLHMQFIPKTGGEGTRIPVSVQFMEIKARSFLGFLSGSAARGLGAVGSLIGSVLGFPFADDLVKWLWGKRKRETI